MDAAPPGGFANVEDEPPQPSRKRGRSPEPAAPRAHLPRVLPAGTRAAILAGVRGDLALQLLDGTAGAHAARVAVDLAGALLTPAAVRGVEAG